MKRCDICQWFRRAINAHAIAQTSISAPWPFSQWGIDILEPFPRTTSQRKYVIVAIEYFSKWLEAKAVRSVIALQMIDFIWGNIICKFGISRVLISNNGTQFDSKEFRKFAENSGVDHRLALVAHPQTNRQIEVTNRTILTGLKKRLNGAKTGWVDKLPSIIWAWRTTLRVATGETPFSLASETKAMVPIEIKILTHRVQYCDELTNNKKLWSNLDALKELRDTASIRTTAYQQKATRYHNHKVKERILKVGGLVLRKLYATGKREGQGSSLLHGKGCSKSSKWSD